MSDIDQSFVAENQWFDEISLVLRHFQIIVDNAEKLDPSRESSYTKQIHCNSKSYLDELLIQTAKRRQHLEGLVGNNAANLVGKLNRFETLRHELASRLTESDASGHETALVLLLRLAIDKGRVHFDRLQPQAKAKDDWGQTASLKSYLKSLRIKPLPNFNHYPGVPQCIMVLAPIWHRFEPVITSSTDKYVLSTLLMLKAENHRACLLEEYRTGCKEEALKRVDAVWKRSVELMEWAGNNLDYEQAALHAFLKKGDPKKDLPVHFPGMVATWGPTSSYMPSCLLDFCRFRAHKPLAAEAAELNTHRRTAFGTDTCAEWAAFLMCARLDLPTSVDCW